MLDRLRPVQLFGEGPTWSACHPTVPCDIIRVISYELSRAQDMLTAWFSTAFHSSDPVPAAPDSCHLALSLALRSPNNRGDTLPPLVHHSTHNFQHGTARTRVKWDGSKVAIAHIIMRAVRFSWQK